jgi:hypothetical protein
VEILNPPGSSAAIVAVDNYDDQLVLQTFNGNDYDVAVMPKTGGQFSTFGSIGTSAQGAIADAGSIYYGTVTTGVKAYIKSVALTVDISTNSTFVAGQDGDHIYALQDAGGGRIWQYNKSGVLTQTLLGTDTNTPGCSVNSIAPVMNTHAIYWVRTCDYVVAIRFMALVGYTISAVSVGTAGSVDSIAADDTNIYWRGRVGANIVTGKTNRMTDVVTILTPPQPNGPRYIAVDATHVYWSTYSSNTAFPDGELRRVPIAGGATEVVAASQYSISSLAVDATHVYWTVNARPSEIPPKPGLILRMEK